MAGTYVEPHSPALGGTDPAAVEAAQAAHAAGMRAHEEKQAQGTGREVGDPRAEEEKLQPLPPRPPWSQRRKGGQ